ncbi:outer membrane protein assembly factor BamB family protein [Myceligenerans indicum]|uniref:PQQ-binding-like beta-propeller repeat protein n=1 Tax=Myceligenerans indicum TaxID=2593663 RepID=A0ABS1LNI4_9MICO|nr:PQQ-binding-like beta-propeller repeat protein [Myceligenerans indicum]MBL0887816.1 PQQ-binding-like beta-propeller repeat protein [Myceligenerans indicum]
MARRERIVFDLVEGERTVSGDDDGEDRADQPRSAGSELLRGLGASVVSGAARAWGWVSRHRMVSLVAAGATAALLVSSVAVGNAREQERLDLLGTAPGGVASLADPPTETWRYAPGGDTNLVGRYGFDVGAVVMGPNVVFLEGDQSGVNKSALGSADTRIRWREADLVAVNAESGEESWRVPLGVDPECTTPGAGGASRVLEEMVCLAGRSDARGVVVVTATGESAGPRRLARDESLSEEVLPAGNGLLFRARVEGDTPRINCSEAVMVPLACTVVGSTPDRTLVVRAEDARSGEEVWRREVPWTGDLGECWRNIVGDDRTDDVPPPGPGGQLSIWNWGAMVHVRTCGIAAAFRPDGTVTPGGTPIAGEELIAEQVYDPERDMLSTTIWDTAGEQVLTTDGWVSEGEATDGTPSDVFVIRGSGNDLAQGYRRDGTRVWEAEGSGVLVARVGDIGMLQEFVTSLRGIDLRTGRTLWEQDGLDAGLARSETATLPFTDGTTVMLAQVGTRSSTASDEAGSVVSAAPGGTRLLAVDARTGRIRWSAERDDLVWFAAAGRLLSVTRDGSLAGHDG